MNCVCDFSRGQWSCRCGAFKAEQDTKLLKKIEELRAKVSTPWPGLTVKMTDSFAAPKSLMSMVDPSGVHAARYYMVYKQPTPPAAGHYVYVQSVFISLRFLPTHLPLTVELSGYLTNARGVDLGPWRQSFDNGPTSASRFIQFSPFP